MKFYDPQIYPVGLVLSRTEDEINKYYNGNEGNPLQPHESIATTYRLKRNTGNYFAVGIVFRKKPTIQTIAHEAFHAAHALMEYIGQDFVYDGTNESWAYLIGWIALQIEDFVNKEYKEEKK